MRSKQRQHGYRLQILDLAISHHLTHLFEREHLRLNLFVLVLMRFRVTGTWRAQVRHAEERHVLGAVARQWPCLSETLGAARDHPQLLVAFTSRRRLGVFPRV